MLLLILLENLYEEKAGKQTYIDDNSKFLRTIEQEAAFENSSTSASGIAFLPEIPKESCDRLLLV